MWSRVDLLIALVTAVLFAVGIYSILRRSLVKVILGFTLLSHSANLLLFTSGGLIRDLPPLIPKGRTGPPEPFADPLPQALVLTAIVISFGITAFLVTLIHHANRKLGTDDAETLKEQGP
jgi:multicomponent Na+:H+ antiporter subunit C